MRTPGTQGVQMPAAGPQPVLYVIACGAFPARQLAPFAGAAQRQGWDVCVIATPDGRRFLDAPRAGRADRPPGAQPDSIKLAGRLGTEDPPGQA